MPNAYPTEQARQAARERLIAQGLSSKEWAELHELSPSTVYAVLNGQHKCLRGDAHRAAVLLGIKPTVAAPYTAAMAQG
ncbi:MAG: DNA-binding protein [Halopseudomonas sp.]|uniref:DNA-binding protein n=1 Tax=Halopseudomonas sp. TaxID=2901191 RepID=UPI003001B14D